MHYYRAVLVGGAPTEMAKGGQMRASTSVTTVPAAPTGLTARGTTDTATRLSWTAAAGATSYNVYENGVKVATVSGTGYTAKRLTADTSYSFGVSAVNDSGESDQASANVKTTAAAGNDVEVSVNGSSQSVSNSGGSASQQVGNNVVTVTVPQGAFSSSGGVQISFVNPTTLAPTVPTLVQGRGTVTRPTLIVGVKVAFPGGPPSVPITMTIKNSKILAGGILYKVRADGTLVLMKATITNGEMVVTFSTDPNFIIVNPPKPVHLKPFERAIVLNGQVFIVPSKVDHQTTYIPIWYVMQVMKKLGMTNQWDGQHWKMTTHQAVNLGHIAAGSGSTKIYLNGTLVQTSGQGVWADPYSHKHTTYVPIWYLMQVLKRVHVSSLWDGKEWVLIPNS